MSEWKPIKTAPKDGTKILVCCFDHGWEMEVSHWVTDEPYVDEDDQEKTYKGWLPMIGISGPTHWMPLPKPPE